MVALIGLGCSGFWGRSNSMEALRLSLENGVAPIVAWDLFYRAVGESNLYNPWCAAKVGSLPRWEFRSRPVAYGEVAQWSSLCPVMCDRFDLDAISRGRVDAWEVVGDACAARGYPDSFAGTMAPLREHVGAIPYAVLATSLQRAVEYDPRFEVHRETLMLGLAASELDLPFSSREPVIVGSRRLDEAVLLTREEEVRACSLKHYVWVSPDGELTVYPNNCGAALLAGLGIEGNGEWAVMGVTWIPRSY